MVWHYQSSEKRRDSLHDGEEEGQSTLIYNIDQDVGNRRNLWLLEAGGEMPGERGWWMKRLTVKALDTRQSNLGFLLSGIRYGTTINVFGKMMPAETRFGHKM
ncbi:hypothetical protein BgiBS90_033194 [Biomphalaria glabrata]|nr:hypothetical protein BgiBS90_033194 [Biomphalaria glabrata]